MNRGIKCLAFVLIGLALVCTTAGSAAAQTSQGIMFAVKEGSGLPGSILEGKTYYFRMLEFNHQPTVYGQRSLIHYGYIEFKSGGIFDATISWSSSDCLSGGPISDTGTYNVNPDWSMTFTGEGGTGPTFFGTISSDGSFVTLSRCENVGGETVQAIIVAVERDPTQTFVLGDISGSYQLSLLSMEEFQTSTASASAVNAELTSDGIGGWTASYTAISSSGVSESGSTSGTYTVDTDGRFEFFEGGDIIFEGYISKEKDKLIISQVICTAADDIEQGIAVAHKIESGRTYGLADLTGNYPFRMLQLHDIESASNRDSEIIVGTANFDGAGNWSTSGITACENEGNTETIPTPDLPYGTYTVDPAGKVILTPTHAGASPGEMWLGSYSADTESVVFTSATVLGAFSITAGVMNVHRPDGTLWTYVDVVIGSDFTGTLPDDISEITVQGPSGPLPLTKANFTYYPQWREFFAILPGSPVTGQYDFTVTSGASFATAVDFQNVNITLPIPENASRVPSDGAIVPTETPEFCWAEVNPPGPPWHYRLEINDMTGNRIYASDRMLGMLCHTLPPGLLVPGESYQWRIRVLDADNWVGVQNRSHSDWFTFTVQAGASFGIIGSVMNVHQSDDTFATFFEVEIGGDFTGTLPNDIDSITITAPSGDLPITKDDFTYNPTWRSFFIALPGSPEMGQYDFTVTSGIASGTAVDFQNLNLSIPIPDPAQRSPANGATVPSPTPQFCWGEISLPPTTLYYRLEINDMSGNRVYATSRMAGMLCHTPPPGTLVSGETYQWRVRVTDADNWVGVQNRANSDWFTFTVQADAFSIMASVIHVRTPDDLHQMYLLVVIGNDFTGALPDDIDSITVEGPSGPLALTKDDFEYEEQWTDFFLKLDGPPEVGTYTFTVTSGTAVATATDVQGPLLDIPLIDQTLLTPPEGEIASSATPTFCWPAVSVPGTTLYYRLQILDLDGNHVYSTSRVAGMLCHTVPAGFLVPGQTYQWRVRVTDANDWVLVNNRTHSGWVTLTVAGADSQGILFGVKEDSGCSAATLAGKRYYFRMLELNHYPATVGHRASVMHGYGDTSAGGDSTMTIWWYRSDGTSSGAVPVVDTGTYSVNADCTFTLTTEGGTGPTVEGDVSADGSFITLSRCENVGGETIQFLYTGVERDPAQTFGPADISGTYHLHLLNTTAFETAGREAEAVNATLFDCDGAGGCTVTYESTDSSGRQETGSVPVSYTVQGDGSVEFAAGMETIFSGYISSDKKQLVVYHAEGTTANEVELAIGTAYQVDPAKTYTVADLTGSYRIRLMQMNGVQSPVMGNQVINGTVVFDGSGNWNASEAWLCYNDGTAGNAPSGDLPYGTYMVDPDGTVILTPMHPGAAPGETWKGSYSPDAQTIAFAMPAATDVFPINVSVMNVHRPDDTIWTYISAEIGSDFTGILPDDIDEITVEGPSGPLPLTKADFSYDPQWREFFIALPGPPEIGLYELEVISGITTAKAIDFQGVNLVIPSPNPATFSYQEGEIVPSTTPTFSWGAVDMPTGAPPGTLLHYRLEVNDLFGNRAYASSRVANMLSHTVPAGRLVFGQSYQWRVRVTDASNWVGVQNRSHSDWLVFTVSDAALTVTVPAIATEGDGTLADAGSVSLTEALPVDLTIVLSSTDTSEVTVPAQVVITQGSLSATFDVTIVNDIIIGGTQSVSIEASALGLVTATATIEVAEDDLDTDGDQMRDDWETTHFGDLSRDGTGDLDNDLLTDREESQYDTVPTARDSEGDGIPDKWEVSNGCDPLVDDSAACLANYQADRPDPPVLLEPGVEVSTGAEQDVALPPVLTTDVFVDNGADNHGATEWQVSNGYDAMDPAAFNDNLVYSTWSRRALLENQMPNLLAPNTRYYWRARVYDDEGADSDWSETFAFETGSPRHEDNNGDDIPDPMELPPGDTTDLNENGVSDGNEIGPAYKCFNAAVGGGQIAISVPPGNVITAVEAIDPAAIDDKVNRPDELPWGLVGFSVAVLNPGDTIDITATMSGTPPTNPEWHLWTAVSGWVSLPAAIITPTPNGNTQVVFTKTDGGVGDADGLVNGVIVDPVGIGAMAAQKITESSGGGGGCFVITAAE